MLKILSHCKYWYHVDGLADLANPITSNSGNNVNLKREEDGGELSTQLFPIIEKDS